MAKIITGARGGITSESHAVGAVSNCTYRGSA